MALNRITRLQRKALPRCRTFQARTLVRRAREQRYHVLCRPPRMYVPSAVFQRTAADAPSRPWPSLCRGGGHVLPREASPGMEGGDVDPQWGDQGRMAGTRFARNGDVEFGRWSGSGAARQTRITFSLGRHCNHSLVVRSCHFHIFSRPLALLQDDSSYVCHLLM